MIPVLLLLLASSMVAPRGCETAGVPPWCGVHGAGCGHEDGEKRGDGRVGEHFVDVPFLTLHTLQPLQTFHPSYDEQNVLKAAESALADIWPDVEVRVVRLSAEAAAAQPPLRVRFLDDAPRGRASADVETRAGDTWVSAGWAYLDVAVFDTALVLTRDVDRGHELADAAKRQRVDVTSTRASLLSPDLHLEGWSAARSLRAGTVLTARLADAPSAVETRAPLRVRYSRGALSVTLSCEARERGAIGDTIRAACSDPRATYHVRLTAPGEGVWTRTL
ncbi:MAG: hypothetical protein Rubg2KO_36580 [Rubricoccaceae bacterium]